MTGRCDLRRDQERKACPVPVSAFMLCSFRRRFERAVPGGLERVIWRDASMRPARFGRREEREALPLVGQREVDAGR